MSDQETYPVLNAFYDSAKNEVSFEKREGEKADYIVHPGPHTMEVVDRKGNSVTFDQAEDAVTPTQAVILFATMLGLRAAAAE